jgi:hypothetical protein
MGGPNDTKEDHGSIESQQQQEQAEGGNSGHGAASALAHMISQGRDHRHQTGEADDAAGATGGEGAQTALAAMIRKRKMGENHVEVEPKDAAPAHPPEG